MKTAKKQKITPIQARKQQIEKELENLKTEQQTKTRRFYKTDEAFEEFRKRRSKKIERLEDELVILDYPGEYDELPLAVVAEELGIRTADVQMLIRMDELEPSDEVYLDRITRAELDRAFDVGVEELLSQAHQTPDEIFEEAVACLQRGDFEGCEEENLRLDAREGWDQQAVLEIVLELCKGNLEDAIRNFKISLQFSPESKALFLNLLGRAISGLQVESYPGQMILERMRAVADGTNEDPYHWRSGSESKQIGKHLDETQQRAMYLAKAVNQSLNKYRRVQSFKSYRSHTSEMRQEEFEKVIRDGLYTALHAEATYNESSASKMYVDSVVASIPMWWARAELMEILPAKSASA